MDPRKIEIFIPTHFALRKLHYRHGSWLFRGVAFEDGEPNGGGWLWWRNDRAILSILFALVLCGLASSGMILRDRTYVSANDLWVPSNAPILQDKHRYESLFGSVDVARIVLTSNSAYKNLLNRPTFLSLWRLHTYLIDNVVATVKGKSYRFNDLCVQVTFHGVSGCYQFNPLAFWPKENFGPGSFKSPGIDVVAAVNDPSRLLDHNPWTNVEDIFGGIFWLNGRILGIEALQIHYFFDKSDKRYTNNPDWDEILQAYEEALLSTLQEYTFAVISPNINLSYNKEIYATMSSDWSFLSISVLIMMAILALSFLSMDVTYHSRLFLGIAAALSITFAITSSRGLTLLLSGSLFDTYAVFLITVLGLNHLFIIIHTYDRVIDNELMKPDPQNHKGQLNPETREPLRDKKAVYRFYVTETLSEAMPSVTVVYLIGIPTFFLGILSEYCLGYNPISGMVSLSCTCALGMFSLYFFINLFFIPALALDAIRIVEKRIDILCLRAKEQTSTQFLPVVGDIEITPELLLPPPPPYERLSHIFFRKAIAPLMAKLPVKISIISIMIFILGLSIWVIANNQLALVPHPLQENLPADSYWAQYYQTWDRYFRETGISSALIITEADYPEEKTYSIINSFLDKLARSECIKEGSIANWYRPYVEYLHKKGLNISNFYGPLNEKNQTNLAVWLDNDGGRYAKFIVLTPMGTVKTAMFPFNLDPLPASDRQQMLEYSQHLRSLVQDDADVQKISHGRAFIYSEDFVFVDETWILTQSFSVKFVSYLVLLLLFSLIFLDIRSTVLVVICTATVACFIYGIFMYYMSMNIAMYSISGLVMLFIVSFDAHLQIAYYWMRDQGSRTTRLVNVVMQIGTSLCCAYFTLFVGMVALMFSLSSPINIYFTYLYVCTSSFSFVISVFVLPIVLSWMGIRRNRIIIKRKQRHDFGGVIWGGLHDQGGISDSYSDEEDDDEDDDDDQAGEGDGVEKTYLFYRGTTTAQLDGETPADDLDDRLGESSSEHQSSSRPDSVELFLQEDQLRRPRSASGTMSPISSMTLDQLFRSADQPVTTKPPAEEQVSSDSDNASDGAETKEKWSEIPKTTLRGLLFGSGSNVYRNDAATTLGGSNNRIEILVPSEGLDSFPSLPPTILNSSSHSSLRRSSSRFFTTK